jgi:hypothetical protein
MANNDEKRSSPMPRIKRDALLYITNFKLMFMEHMEKTANCAVVQKFNTTEVN